MSNRTGSDERRGLFSLSPSASAWKHNGEVIAVSRIIDQPIQVTAVPSPDGLAPSTFVWRGSSYRVEAVLDCWQETGCRREQ